MRSGVDIFGKIVVLLLVDLKAKAVKISVRTRSHRLNLRLKSSWRRWEGKAP